MIELLTYPFFIRAIIAALLVSICCGIIGSYIVTRRIVFIAGGISHSSFGGIGIGYYLGFNPILGAALFSVFSGFLIEYLAKKAEMRIDTLIGIIWSFGMAVGIFFVFITPGYAPNLIAYLFGNILTVSAHYLMIMGALALFTITIFVALYRSIVFVAFDEEFAKTQHVSVNIINYLIIALTALTIVISIKVVGIILVISLLTIPQVTASLFTHDLKKIILLSISIAFISSLLGLVSAHFLEIPSGATIIFCSVVIFAVLKLYHTSRQKMRIFMKLNGT